MKNVTKSNVLFTATVLVYLIMVYSIRLLPANMLSMNFLLIVPEIILLIPSIFYVVFLRPGDVGEYGCARVSIPTALLTLILAYCIIPVVSLINGLSSFFVENSVDDTLTLVTNSNPLIVNLIIMALLPAVVEEFIFRGLIFNGYRRRNPWKAALLSAFLFGLIHMNVNQFSYAFVIGVIFALLTYATGSIIPSIIAHFVINGTSVVMSYLLSYVETLESSEQTLEAVSDIEIIISYIITYGMLISMVVGGVVIGWLVFKSICKNNRGYENVKLIFRKDLRSYYDDTQGKFFDGYLLIGVGICLIYIILYDFIL